MSLQLALLMIVSFAAASLAAAKYYSFARADLDRLRQQEYWTQRFRDGCREMLQDSRSSETDLRALLAFNDFILNPSVCLVVHRAYAELVATGSWAGSLDGENSSSVPDDHGLASRVGDTFLAGLMAVTYANLKWGEKTRGLMAHHYGNYREATKLATRAVRAVSQNGQDLPSDLVAA